MYPDIADNLKTKIDKEMNNLVSNTKLITIDQYITSIDSKELENMKSELLSYNKYVLSQQQTMEKQKVLVKVKEAGIGFIINSYFCIRNSSWYWLYVIPIWSLVCGI